MRAHLRTALCWALLFPIATPALAQTATARQVAAPASDIRSGLLRLPDPSASAASCSAAILPLHFERTQAGSFAATLSYPVERSGELALVLVSPMAAGWKLLLGPADEPLRPLEQSFAHERRTAMAGEWLPGWVAVRLDLHGVSAGLWNLRVEGANASAVDSGWLFACANPELRASAFVDTQHLVSGAPIAVIAQASGRDLLVGERARLLLETEGERRELPMHDDGAHADGLAGDGRFGAFVPVDLLGRVRAQADISGLTRSGHEFLRSAQLAFPLLAPQLLLDGSAQAQLRDDGSLEISLGVLPEGPLARVHVSAEVWGRDASGSAAPVCWLSKMLVPREQSGAWQLPLQLDLDWLEVEGLQAPLELRAVRVQDPDTEVVFDALERVEFPTPTLNRPRISGRPISAKMLTGEHGTTIGATGSTAPPEYPQLRSLLLVHGYCSSGSIWPAADFSQPKLEFLDPNANRSHDQFAQLLAQRASSQNLWSFGIVAHSQGGPAALHLLTYYNSGLDRAFGGRRIQSVAAPYQGTPLASLGTFACGVNNDMTPAGAATWLAGIPTWARAEVSTWTTANSGAPCNFFTNLLLTDPEDGTVEKVRSELPGGNNLGHVLGWCHTTGMTNPANYTDHARNLAMSAAASR